MTFLQLSGFRRSCFFHKTEGMKAKENPATFRVDARCNRMQ